jgi:predicted XRE-type DNA-binding protein
MCQKRHNPIVEQNMKKTTTKSSGNVSRELGLANPEECFEKANLGCELIRTIKEKHLTQAQAAKILKTDQAKVSFLMNGRFQGFSLSRLIRFLEALGKRVSFIVEEETAVHQPRARLAGTRVAAER